ncbi:MAG: acyltransferase family protein, partial [Actinomycetota bacterium]
LWLVAAFAIVAGVVDRLRSLRGLERPIPASVADGLLLALPILTIGPQLLMKEPVFGPDTSEGLIPAWHVLGYYACFFFWGALAHDRRSDDGRRLIRTVGDRWPALLGLSVGLFAVGVFLVEDQTGWLAALTQWAFAWTMSFCLLGLFAAVLMTERFAVRWLSDASYWMYLTHLPLIFVLQGVAAAWDLPAIPAFIGICAVTFVLLAITYRWLIRYTPIGSLLNGSKNRAADALTRARLAEAERTRVR